MSLWFSSNAQQTQYNPIIPYLKEHTPLFSQIPDLNLSLCYENHSAHSFHERYALLYQQVPILDRYISVHYNQHHQLLSVCYEMEGVEKLMGYDLDEELKNWQGILPQELFKKNDLFFNNLKSTALKVDMNDESPHVVMEAKAWSKTYDRSRVMNLNGEIMREINYERNYTDTTIHAKIFNPDPLTTLQQNYGGLYVDSNDLHQNWMNSAYQTVGISAQYSVDSFYLQNNWVTLVEFEAPVQMPAVQNNSDFFFTRSESGFEDVNVLYHITQFHEYLSSLGYDSLMSMGVLVDAHAQFGADNSVFSRNGGNPTLRYGTGGVDDAEDADVIIHEYAHGLSWSANGNDNFSTERSALDEGVADYFATSYSHSLSLFHCDQVFNWDGHNEFWGGRIANSSNMYPSSAGIYTTGEIWNSAMSAVWNDLGAAITDKLMLEAMYFFNNSTTLPEAAMYVLQADTLLFGGQFSNTLCFRFQQRNILDSNCKPVSVIEPINEGTFTLSNTRAFAEGEGEAYVSFPEIVNGSWVLFNVEGKPIRSGIIRHENHIRLSPDFLTSGLYVLQLVVNNHSYHVQLIRY